MSLTGLGLTMESLIMRIGGTSVILSLLVAAHICVGLLLIGSPGRSSIAIITALIGIYSVTGGMTGYLLGDLRVIERVAFSVGGILVVYPSYVTDYSRLGIIVLAVLYRIFTRRRKRSVSPNPIVSSQSEKGDSA